MTALQDDLRDWLHDPDFAWSIGAMGAIAEFAWDRDEPATRLDRERGGTVVTARGALRVGLTGNEKVVAYEGLSARADRWTTGLDVCLREAGGHMNRRTALTEIGGDGDALDPASKGTPLFDLGLGLPNLDACVRTDDEALLRMFRANAGRSLFQPDNPVMAAIKEASPPRIFISRIARIEVYQRIGSTAKGVPTPPGPHTHILPDLLKTGRVHSATVPVPKGWLPAVTLHPGLFVDQDGNERPFDPDRFWRLQDLLARYGPEGYVAEKRRIAEAVQEGVDPSAYKPAGSRTARLAARVALRQLPYLCGENDIDIAPWRARFDRGAPAAAGQGH